MTLVLLISSWQVGSAADDLGLDAQMKEILKSSKKAMGATQFADACREMLKITDAALAADDYVLASRASIAAGDLATKSGGMRLSIIARSSKDDVQLMTKEFKSLSSALKKLESTPDDPDANRKVGLFVSALRGDWKRGAEMLGKSGNPLFNKISSGELTPPENAAEQMVLAAAWKEAAESQTAAVKLRMQKRAHYWIQRAYRSAEGSVRQKYIDELGGLSFRYLSDFEEFDAVNGAWPFSKYGVIGRDESFPIAIEGIPFSQGLGMHPPSYNKPFSVKFKIGGKFKTFQSGCSLNDSAGAFQRKLNFVVYGDGRLLWTSSPIQSKADGDIATINVKGVQILELQTTATDSDNCHAVWLDPILTK